MDYDDFLCEIGSFGRYQRKKYVLIILPAIVNCMIAFAPNYLDAEPPHRCFIPGCDPDSSDVTPSFTSCTNGTIPPESAAGGGLHSCRRYVFNSSQYPPARLPTPLNTTTTNCHRWVFDLSTYHNTTVTQWNLVCQHNYLRVLSETMYIVGVLVGSIIFGNLGDKIGRRPTMLIAIILTLIIGNITSFAPLFALYVVGRFCLGATLQGIYLAAYVMAVELVGPKDRVLAGTGLAISFALGYFMLAPVAYFIRDWHYLHLATCAPVVFLLVLYWYIPESMRWLLSKERYVEADRLAVQAARTNGYPQIEAPVFARHSKQAGRGGAASEGEQDMTMIDILRIPPLLLRSLNIFYMWIVASLVYFGLSLNVSSLGGNVYVDVVLSGLVEAVGYALSIPVLNRCGRKVPLVGFYFLCGVFLVSTAFTRNYHTVTIILSLLGKLCICGAFADVYIYTGELYPTAVRNAALGTASMFSRIGAVAAPYVDYSGGYIQSLPNLIFGGTAVAAAVLACFLPETINLPLPDTIQDTLLIGSRVVTAQATHAGYRRITNVEYDDDVVDGDERTAAVTDTDDVSINKDRPRVHKQD